MAAESCSTCRWATPWPPMGGYVETQGATTYRPMIRCVRFPQSVTNSPDYWCGEFLPKKD